MRRVFSRANMAKEEPGSPCPCFTPHFHTGRARGEAGTLTGRWEAFCRVMFSLRTRGALRFDGGARARPVAQLHAPSPRLFTFTSAQRTARPFTYLCVTANPSPGPARNLLAQCF